MCWMPLLLSAAALAIALMNNTANIVPQGSVQNDIAVSQESQAQIKQLAKAVEAMQGQLKRTEERMQALRSSSPVQVVAQSKSKATLPVAMQPIESDEERLDREKIEFENSPVDSKTKMALETQFSSLLADKRYQNIFMKRVDCRDLGCKIELEAQGADASQLATELLFGMENPPDSFSISPGDDNGESSSTVIRINHS